jgi:plasmid stability protein
MAITLKNLPEETRRELQRRAASHGCSLEEEALACIEFALKAGSGKPLIPNNDSLWEECHEIPLRARTAK